MKAGIVAFLVPAGLIVLLGVAFWRFVPRDRAAWIGVAAGAALGIANLVFGYYATRSALRKGPAAALRTMLGGFFLRLLALVALVLWFQRGSSVNATAFAIAFFAFFFVFLAVEVRMVAGSPGRGRQLA